MKKILNKRVCGLLLAAVCLLALLLPRASAAGTVDTAKPVSLTVSCRYAGQAVQGVSFDLYRVADIDAFARFTLCGDFQAYPVRLDGLSGGNWRALAVTLAAYAARDRLTPQDAGETDGRGLLRFPSRAASLLPGLYLVVGKQTASGGKLYSAEPFLVSLPDLDEAADRWIYDVSAAPKLRADEPGAPGGTTARKVLKIWDDGQSADRPRTLRVQLLQNGAVYDTVTLSGETNWRYTWDALPKYGADGALIRWDIAELVPDGYTVLVSSEGGTFVLTNSKPANSEPPPPTPGGPDTPILPQTGSLWWPVPVLAACGLLLLLLGLRKKR